MRTIIWCLSACAFAHAGAKVFGSPSNSLTAALSSTTQGFVRWTPETSIAVRYFGREPANLDLMEMPTAGDFGLPVWFSPSGEFFFAVLHHGDIASNSVVYELEVFAVADIAVALSETPPGIQVRPRCKAVIPTVLQGSQLTDAGIFKPRWESNNAILFVGLYSADNGALYRLNVESGQLSQLTPSGTPPYYVQSAGGAILYLGGKVIHEKRTPTKPFQPIRSNLLEFLGEGSGSLRGQLDVVAGTTAHFPRTIASIQRMRTSVAPISPTLSPDGKFALVMKPAYQERDDGSVVIPEEWAVYAGLDHTSPSEAGKDGHFDPFGMASADSYSRMWRPVLIDLESGEANQILNSPMGGDATAPNEGTPRLFWSEDGKRLVFVNICQPTDKPNDSHAFVAIYDRDRRTWEPVTMMSSNDWKVASVAWQEKGRSLAISYSVKNGPPRETSVVSLMPPTVEGPGNNREERWEDLRSMKRTDLPFKLEMRESANHPPELLASNGEREISIFGADPALDRKVIAQTTIMQLTDDSGEQFDIGIVLPARPNQKGPHPTVIQFEGLRTSDSHDHRLLPRMAERFLPDGVSATAFSAQSLAGADIAVIRLNVSSRRSFDRKWWAEEMKGVPRWRYEGDLVARRVDQVVRVLVDKGVIDPAKIGLVGFSRTGYYVHYLLTHPRMTFTPAAAIIADSTTQSYEEYCFTALSADSPAGRKKDAELYEAVYGGSFWDAKGAWVEQSPLFNVERVQCPVLFSLNLPPAGLADEANPQLSAAAVSTLGSIIGAYTFNNKEFDVYLYPDAAHQLVRPSQRLASLQSTVDWMSFWLLDRENEQKTKSTKYIFWRTLKQRRDERWAKEGSPSVVRTGEIGDR